MKSIKVEHADSIHYSNISYDNVSSRERNSERKDVAMSITVPPISRAHQTPLSSFPAQIKTEHLSLETQQLLEKANSNINLPARSPTCLIESSLILKAEQSPGAIFSSYNDLSSIDSDTMNLLFPLTEKVETHNVPLKVILERQHGEVQIYLPLKSESFTFRLIPLLEQQHPVRIETLYNCIDACREILASCVTFRSDYLAYLSAVYGSCSRQVDKFCTMLEEPIRQIAPATVVVEGSRAYSEQDDTQEVDIVDMDISSNMSSRLSRMTLNASEVADAGIISTERMRLVLHVQQTLRQLENFVDTIDLLIAVKHIASDEERAAKFISARTQLLDYLAHLTLSMPERFVQVKQEPAEQLASASVARATDCSKPFRNLSRSTAGEIIITTQDATEPHNKGVTKVVQLADLETLMLRDPSTVRFLYANNMSCSTTLCNVERQDRVSRLLPGFKSLVPLPAKVLLEPRFACTSETSPQVDTDGACLVIILPQEQRRLLGSDNEQVEDSLSYRKLSIAMKRYRVNWHLIFVYLDMCRGVIAECERYRQLVISFVKRVHGNEQAMLARSIVTEFKVLACPTITVEGMNASHHVVKSETEQSYDTLLAQKSVQLSEATLSEFNELHPADCLILASELIRLRIYVEETRRCFDHLRNRLQVLVRQDIAFSLFYDRVKNSPVAKHLPTCELYFAKLPLNCDEE